MEAWARRPLLPLQIRAETALDGARTSRLLWSISTLATLPSWHPASKQLLAICNLLWKLDLGELASNYLPSYDVLTIPAYPAKHYSQNLFAVYSSPASKNRSAAPRNDNIPATIDTWLTPICIKSSSTRHSSLDG